MTFNNLEIYENRDEYYEPLIIIFIVIGVISIPITLLPLIATIKLFRKKTAVELKISLGILILDFSESLCMLILALAGKIDGKYLPTHTWACNASDVFYIASLYGSIWYVGLMSLERGLLIIHGISLPSFFWVSLMIAELLFFLVINLISIAWGEIGLVDLALACITIPDSTLGYITFNYYFYMLVINVIFTIYSYIGIAIVQRRRAWKEIRELNTNKEQALYQANRTIFKVLLLLLIYLVANGYEFVNVLMEASTGEIRSAKADFISACLVCLGPIVNSIILVQFHDSVKKSLLQTFPFLKIIFKTNNQTHVN